MISEKKIFPDTRIVTEINLFIKKSMRDNKGRGKEKEAGNRKILDE